MERSRREAELSAQQEHEREKDRERDREREVDRNAVSKTFYYVSKTFYLSQQYLIYLFTHREPLAPPMTVI